MKHTDIEHEWDAIKGQLKKRFAQLTDDDLALAKGKGEELFSRLRGKLGLTAHDFEALLDEVRDKAGGTLEHIKATASEFAEAAREKTGEVAGAFREKAAAIGEDAKVKATAAYDTARKSARNLLEDGTEYVRHNPRQSLLAAICAGFVAGLMIRR